MSKILLSINPEYVDKIFNGTKEYEFRKVGCKRVINKIIIYSTAPIKKVVGEATVERILSDKPDIVWEMTKKKAGINSDFFYNYYRGKHKAIAYKLGQVKEYDAPVDLDYYNVTTPPQSFIYLD